MQLFFVVCAFRISFELVDFETRIVSKWPIVWFLLSPFWLARVKNVLDVWLNNIQVEIFLRFTWDRPLASSIVLVSQQWNYSHDSAPANTDLRPSSPSSPRNSARAVIRLAYQHKRLWLHHLGVRPQLRSTSDGPCPPTGATLRWVPDPLECDVERHSSAPIFSRVCSSCPPTRAGCYVTACARVNSRDRSGMTSLTTSFQSMEFGW